MTVLRKKGDIGGLVYMNDTLYFSDNFFSAGTTDIYNSAKEKVGELDLKSAFSASIDVLNKDGKVIVSGKFPIFTSKWIITDTNEQEIGVLKGKFTFFTKKYEYTAHSRGVYQIEAEAFSHQYEIFDEQSTLIAKFEKVSGFFSSPAYQLSNFNEEVTSEELIAVIMGINAIQKRRNNSAANGS
jgi:uncharacterized protein YxjI